MTENIPWDKLSEPNSGLGQLRRGIEKESLRITADGTLSGAAHPTCLGSALTHPFITTDFSEAQLELITGIHESATACLDELEATHAFVHHCLESEMLWPSSMPCILAANEDQIPLGQYGSSNIGRAKTIYRRGLGYRYGRLMQTISGIHYNFSVPDSLWQTLGVTSQTEITANYFGLIRNFKRWSWLLFYLFGASPAVCQTFLANDKHGLREFLPGTFYLPHATCLRMGPLGYISEAQHQLSVSYNSLADYSASLAQALTEQYPPYANLGADTLDTEPYPQLNSALLQIENEFYSTIRPKRTTQSGERPLQALDGRGVEYVEVRCVDLNPLQPIGIEATQVRFLDVFLVACLLNPSAMDTATEIAAVQANELAVVANGRDPVLELIRDGQSIGLREWANAILDLCEPVAEAIDAAGNGIEHRQALAEQRHKVTDVSLTPSAQMLDAIEECGSFFNYSMQYSQAHKAYFAAHPLTASALQRQQESAALSHVRQEEIETEETQAFEAFLDQYLATR